MALTLSPSLSFMMRTPWVFLPMLLILLTGTRMACPWVVMKSTSSSSVTVVMPATGPFFSVILILMTPLPPRLVSR